MKRLAFLTACALILLSGGAANAQVAKTASWTWPTKRTDGSTLALTQIGSATIYDQSVNPAPGVPGTVVPCNTALTFPPTTANASCPVTVIAGHTFVLVVTDNSNPPESSPTSNAVVVPLSVPAAVTNFAIQ